MFVDGESLGDILIEDDLSFEMKVDTKLYSQEEGKENLVKDWKIKFPKWGTWIRRAYKEIWSGDINYEEIRFSGYGEDFNEWLKTKRYKAHRERLVETDKVKTNGQQRGLRFFTRRNI